MNSRRNYFLLAALCFAGLPSLSDAGTIRTVADLDAMKAEAGKSKKLVVVFVTSSAPDCHDCKRMRKDYMGDREFMDWINRFAVFGEFDASIRGRSAAEVETINAVRTAIQAPLIPAMVLIHFNGKMLEYQPVDHVPSQAATLFHEIYMVELNGLQRPGSATVTVGAPSPKSGGKPASPAPAYAPINAVPVNYDVLRLRSITGTGTRRFALINDQALPVGEYAKVTLKGRKVSLQVQEIRDDQVIVQIHGEPKPRILSLERPGKNAPATKQR